MTASQRSRDSASMISCGIASARTARSGSAPSGLKGRIAIDGLPENCSGRPLVSVRDAARAGAERRDLRDEAEAPPVHCLDHLLPGAVIVHGLTRRADATGDAGVRNRSPLPDRLHDLVLGDHAAMVPDEMNQQGKHLGLERHGNAVARELEQIRVEMKVSERPGHEQFYTKSGEVLQEIFRLPSSTGHGVL